MERHAEIQAEFEKAEQARAKGNEGQARVCARRAAGIAARKYLARRGVSPQTTSAYDVLGLIADDPALSRQMREYATHLTLRVNEEFKLPSGIDLIDEARKLCS